MSKLSQALLRKKSAVQESSPTDQSGTSVITADDIPEECRDYESKKGGLLGDNPIPLWKRIEVSRKQLDEYRRLMTEYLPQMIAETEQRIKYLSSLVDSNTFNQEGDDDYES